MEDSNQLLHFLTTATSNLQEALSKPSNSKKVNHRKYIQKRLQKRDTKVTRKTKAQPSSTAPVAMTTTVRPQPVATMPLQSMSRQTVTNSSCKQLYHHLPTSSSSSSPPLTSSHSLSYSRPPSCPQTYDPEFESLLSEIFIDSPSRYSDSTIDHRQHSLSRQPSLNNLNWETYLPSDFIPSPPSDFSDVDVEDSAHSSPRNPSPVYYHSVPDPTCYQQRVATASCEWLPSSTNCGPFSSTTIFPSSLLNVPTLAPSSLNEILEQLVTP